MNKKTRQTVLLLGIMSFLVLIFLSFQLTSDNTPDRTDYEPSPDEDVNDTQPPDDGQNGSDDSEQRNPKGLIDQSVRGLTMLMEDFIAGVSYFL
jgi:hypothetical protein